MKSIYSAFILLFFFFGFMFMGWMWINAEIDAKQYRMYYESMRSELEAFQRTTGMGVDSAFVCKIRTNEQ